MRVSHVSLALLAMGVALAAGVASVVADAGQNDAPLSGGSLQKVCGAYQAASNPAEGGTPADGQAAAKEAGAGDLANDLGKLQAACLGSVPLKALNEGGETNSMADAEKKINEATAGSRQQAQDLANQEPKVAQDQRERERFATNTGRAHGQYGASPEAVNSQYEMFKNEQGDAAAEAYKKGFDEKSTTSLDKIRNDQTAGYGIPEPTGLKAPNPTAEVEGWAREAAKQQGNFTPEQNARFEGLRDDPALKAAYDRAYNQEAGGVRTAANTENGNNYGYGNPDQKVTPAQAQAWAREAAKQQGDFTQEQNSRFASLQNDPAAKAAYDQAYKAELAKAEGGTPTGQGSGGQTPPAAPRNPAATATTQPQATTTRAPNTTEGGREARLTADAQTWAREAAAQKGDFTPQQNQRFASLPEGSAARAAYDEAFNAERARLAQQPPAGPAAPPAGPQTQPQPQPQPQPIPQTQPQRTGQQNPDFASMLRGMQGGQGGGGSQGGGGFGSQNPYGNQFGQQGTCPIGTQLSYFNGQQACINTGLNNGTNTQCPAGYTAALAPNNTGLAGYGGNQTICIATGTTGGTCPSGQVLSVQSDGRTVCITQTTTDEAKLRDQAGYLDGVRVKDGACGLGIDDRFKSDANYLAGYNRGQAECRAGTGTTTSTTTVKYDVSDARARALCGDQIGNVSKELKDEKSLFILLFRERGTLSDTERKALGFDETIYKRLIEAKNQFDSGKADAVSVRDLDSDRKENIGYREGYTCGRKMLESKQ